MNKQRHFKYAVGPLNLFSFDKQALTLFNNLKDAVTEAKKRVCEDRPEVFVYEIKPTTKVTQNIVQVKL